MTNPNASAQHLPPESYFDEACLSSAYLHQLQTEFAQDMAKAAPDLNSKDLAARFAASLFGKLAASGVCNIEQLTLNGAEAFYKVGKEVIGPLTIAFVDTVLQDCPAGKVIFPARDATPFFHVARTLIILNPKQYKVTLDDLHNPVFNRQLWGVNDEQDQAGSALQIQDPLVQQLLTQLGFNAPQPISFVEVGAWGTMVDSLKGAMQAEIMANKPFNTYFLYSHMPNNIYGFLNAHCPGGNNGALETIADSFEALPKTFMRPTKLLANSSGHIVPDLTGKFIPSPFLQPWSDAVLTGLVDAARDYVANGQPIDVQAELTRLSYLSLQAANGEFSGILPDHTETWSEGENWKLNWKWGKALPLQEGGQNV